MMGMRMTETCWAVFKRQEINLRNCCIWLVDLFECMMMHGLTNPKLENVLLVYVKSDRSVLFNEAVNCWGYTASVAGKWNLIMEHWWNDTKKGKSKHPEEKICPSTTFSIINYTAIRLNTLLSQRLNQYALHDKWIMPKYPSSSRATMSLYFLKTLGSDNKVKIRHVPEKRLLNCSIALFCKKAWKSILSVEAPQLWIPSPFIDRSGSSV